MSGILELMAFKDFARLPSVVPTGVFLSVETGNDLIKGLVKSRQEQKVLLWL